MTRHGMVPCVALASEELHAADGYKTEYVRYYLDGGRAGHVSDHWWYDHGKPIKRERYGGRVIFDSTKSADKNQ